MLWLGVQLQPPLVQSLVMVMFLLMKNFWRVANPIVRGGRETMYRTCGESFPLCAKHRKKFPRSFERGEEPVDFLNA
jgi:hypothetical protein